MTIKELREWQAENFLINSCADRKREIVCYVKNPKCPYGYEYCFKRSRDDDSRYIKTLRCNWFVGEFPILFSMFCFELETPE